MCGAETVQEIIYGKPLNSRGTMDSLRLGAYGSIVVSSGMPEVVHMSDDTREGWYAGQWSQRSIPVGEQAGREC